MDYLNKFNIEFSGLCEGVHVFEYEVEKKFFETYKNIDIEDSNVHVTLEMLKQSNMLTFTLSLEGTLNLTCDRCLDNFDFQIKNINVFYVKFGKSSYEESDDVIVLSDTEHKINIAQFIYEYIMLSIPAKVVHPENDDGQTTCNKDFLKKLREFEPDIKATVDPRWEALKKLKDTNN